MAETVVAVYGSHSAAVRGVEELRKCGFSPQQVSILTPDPREVEGFGDEVGVRVIQAGGLGVAAGGLLGGLAGWFAGLTGLLIPGAGIVLAVGPLAGALIGAAGGASVGGFVGMLVGLGLPRHAAEQYEKALREGQTLVVVHPDGEYGLAERALNAAHPIGIHHYNERIGATTEELEREAARRSYQPVTIPTADVAPSSPDRSLSPDDVPEHQETMLRT
jgi:hypothetical protein